MRIILSGGGTLGSVTPLIAVAEDLKTMETGVEFLWLGTKRGPEKKIIEEAGIKFKPIFSGKLRRYLSLRNILDLFLIKLAVWQSLFIIIKEKPDLVVSAGTSDIPVAEEAALTLQIMGNRVEKLYPLPYRDAERIFPRV